MIGRRGARIQEDLGDSIRIYKAEEWAEEMKKRQESGFELPTEEDDIKPVKKAKGEKTDLIEDDKEEEIVSNGQKAKTEKLGGKPKGKKK